MKQKSETISFQQYQQVRQSFLMPLKIKMFFSLLEHAHHKHITPEAARDLEKKYKKLLAAFRRQTEHERALFLYHTACSVRALLQPDFANENNSSFSNDAELINEIETTCKVRESFMGVTVWDKADFKFSRKACKVKLSEGKRDICLKLPHYLMRASHKNSNSLVFEAISDCVEHRREEVCVCFGDRLVMEEVRHNIFSCIVEHTARELASLQEEKAGDDLMETVGEMTKMNSILNPKMLSDYFQMKEKILSKLQNCSFGFEEVDSGSSDLQIGRSYHKHKERVKIDKRYSEGFSSVAARISLLSKKKDKKLVEFEILEKFSDRISVSYFKFMFRGQSLEFLAIVEDTSKQGQQGVIFKGIDNFISSQLLDFLALRLQETGPDSCTFSILGIFNSACKKQSLYVDFLLHLIEGEESDSTASGNHDDYPNPSEEENFWTVKSMREIQLEEEPDHNITQDFADLENSAKFRKQESTASNTILSNKYYVQEPTKQPSNFFLTQHPLFVDWKVHSKGGVICLNEEQIEEQKKVFKNVISQISNNIMARKSILNISLPVTIFRKESHLKTVGRNFSFAPLLLGKVVGAAPLQRMKQVALLQISMAYLTICMNKPFNPILGETYQGLVDGCPIYLEQISHHPPISSYQLYGRGFRLHGLIEPKVSIGMNSINGYSPHKVFIKFDDGSEIDYTINKMVIGGMLFGDRTFNFEDTNIIIDHKNRLACEVFYGKNPAPVFKKAGQTRESVSAIIYEIEGAGTEPSTLKKADRTILSILDGIWHSEIRIDGQKQIDFRETLPHALVDHPHPLPSDSCCRQDIQWLIKGNIEEAQKEKDFLEELQRRDKKLREGYNKKHS